MSLKGVTLAATMLCCGFCYGQTSYTIPLEKLNPSLAVPAMTASDGVVYVAYRSFDWMRQSDQLQVLAYDLNSRKVLRHGTIAVPKVHGARATSGLALSRDGTMLAYVELHEPSLELLISAKDLAEIRRSNVLPFTGHDYRRVFAGFDGEDHLSVMSFNQDAPRFVRVSTSDFKVVSDTRASAVTKAVYSSYLTWNPVVGRAHRRGTGDGYSSARRGRYRPWAVERHRVLCDGVQRCCSQLYQSQEPGNRPSLLTTSLWR